MWFRAFKIWYLSSLSVSRLAQERLRNGKTVELQDLNTPQNIADMYTETYNREWSSAYEELNQSFRDGGETIRHLLQILEVQWLRGILYICVYS